MELPPTPPPLPHRAGWILLLLSCVLLGPLPSARAANELLAKEGDVQRAAPQGDAWQPADAGQLFQDKERLRTGRLSRATVQLTDRSILRVNELTTMTFAAPRQEPQKAGLNLLSGMAYFFSREKPEEIAIETPVVSGAIRGTEFNLRVAPDGATQLALYDGEVQLSNPHGTVTLGSGELGEVQPGRAPVKSPMIEGRNIIQWCLYYPAVVSPNDIPFSAADSQLLGPSLQAYQNGNLLKALERLPGRAPATGSNPARLYSAALLLAAGQVPQAEALLQQCPPGQPAVRALQLMLAAVRGTAGNNATAGSSASEQLALSYARQSVYDLTGALDAARNSAAADPRFGFAHARIAELEFSSGRDAAALRALDSALLQSPQNAQAHAVQGFLLAGRKNIPGALQAFETALAIDPALGNAWLGRGLTKIFSGDLIEGRRDLQVAATTEPTRSLLRSYLAKAFSNEDDLPTALKEIDRAAGLDPHDPTVPLYRGLMRQKQGRYNEAVRDLEQSQALNDNRKLYRSRLLLDQDQAVRRANLARIYQNAGLNDHAVREAIGAVEDDYTNFSSHLFLANTFDSLRDPNGIDQRYETAWFNELLLANLFAPVGAGTLSPFVSQQEYSRLFEGDRFGFLSITDYRSDGRFTQQLDQSGVLGKFGYSLSGSYALVNGEETNTDQYAANFWGTFKYQPTPDDILFFQINVADAERGDVRRFYDPADTRPDLSFDEEFVPNLILGYNHRWAPGHHTLLTAARLSNQQYLSDLQSPQDVALRDPLTNAIIAGAQIPYDVVVENDLLVYSIEAQHIAEFDWHRWIAGAAFQKGSIEASSSLDDPTVFPGVLPPGELPVDDDLDDDLTRAKGYLYLTINPVDRLSLTGGVAIDYLESPYNYRRPPVDSGQIHSTKILPKAAAQWEPADGLTFRAAYAQTRGGVSYEESVRLEPVQLAGFNQAFRTVIPESEINSVEGPDFQIYGIAADFKLPAGFYLGATAQRIESDVLQNSGAFDVFPPLPDDMEASGLTNLYDYGETLVEADLSKLIGDWFTLGIDYQFRESKLDRALPEFPPADRTEEAILHRWRARALCNHPSGFYSGLETVWYLQDNDGYGGARIDDQFQHLNTFFGYRFWETRGDLRLGLLNLTGDDYRLNPLSVYDSTLPRHRVVSVTFKLE